MALTVGGGSQERVVSALTMTTWLLTQAKPRTHRCAHYGCVKEEQAHRTLLECLEQWPVGRHVPDTQ